MLYLIGLGLDEKGISLKGFEAIKKCRQVYLDSYTVNYPYAIKNLEKAIGKKIISLDREKIESDFLINMAKSSDIALLVYGSPLIATTHISLIQEAKKHKIKYEIIHNASILDAITETGLQLYKFGKITNIPKWDKEKNFTPDSFIDITKENLSINAHTLLLADIDLSLDKALEQLVKASKNKIKIDKIIVCSQLGAKNSKILYKNIDELKTIKNINAPYCIIIPGKLHFMEEEALENN